MVQRVAICIAGQYRSHNETIISIEKHIITPLRRNFTIDLFYAVDKDGDIYADNHRVVAYPIKNRHEQFKRFETCGQLIRSTNKYYEWAIRMRPDMLFEQNLYLNGLLSDRLYANFRCIDPRRHPTVYISELAPELRRRVDNLCGFTLCSNTTDVISDQFAIIPQRYIYTYFSDINYTKPGKMPEDTLSVHMVNNNVKFAPFSLRMCIHRSGKPLTCPSIQDRLLRCS